MTTTAPPLTGQDINLAAHATRTLLIAELGPTGLSFEQWIVVNLVGTGQADTVGAIHQRLSTALGLDGPTIDGILDALVDDDQLVRTDQDLRLSAAGEQRWHEAQAVVADVVASLYTGLAADDLAVTRRVLVEVTRRAETRLSA